ncbi:hypothetical protein P5V15_006329 [Pogonomyrmex californicus]
MARVALALSFALISLRLRSDATRYRKEEEPTRGKDASFLARTLLHHRRAATMADDKRATHPHRIRERQISGTYLRNSYALAKMPALFTAFSPLECAFIRQTTLNSQFGISRGVIARHTPYAGRKSRTAWEF